jgi:hypothetical protein
MKPMSGKIDRDRLPRLSHSSAPDDPAAGQAAGRAAASGQAPPAGDTVAPADSGEVLAICRSVFDYDLGWDDIFADSGGHSIVIAQLAQRLQAAGCE